MQETHGGKSSSFHHKLVLGVTFESLIIKKVIRSYFALLVRLLHALPRTHTPPVSYSIW